MLHGHFQQLQVESDSEIRLRDMLLQLDTGRLLCIYPCCGSCAKIKNGILIPFKYLSLLIWIIMSNRTTEVSRTACVRHQWRTESSRKQRLPSRRIQSVKSDIHWPRIFKKTDCWTSEGASI